jgi:hypothetical protein
MITLTIGNLFEVFGAGAFGGLGVLFWLIARTRFSEEAGDRWLGLMLAFISLAVAVGLLCAALVVPVL